MCVNIQLRSFVPRTGKTMNLTRFLSLLSSVARYWKCVSEQQPDRGDQTENQDERVPELGTTALSDHLHCSANTQVLRNTEH